MPTVVVFTKFDQAVALESGGSARTSARARFEQSCRSVFRKEPRDVPAEMVSGNYSLICSSVQYSSDGFIDSQ